MKRNLLLIPVLKRAGRVNSWKVVAAVYAGIVLLPAFLSINLANASYQRSNVLYSRATVTAPPAPWSKPRLSASQVPQVFLNQWVQAGNRKSVCAVIAPISLGAAQGAKPRPANFGSGAWAIAYDQPGLPGRTSNGEFCADCGRGAFGIAGTSVNADAPRYQGFLLHRQWADGSRADYGLTGSNSPPYLANLTIKGQSCLYQVWSFLGRSHLEYLLEHLRFIAGAP